MSAGTSSESFGQRRRSSVLAAPPLGMLDLGLKSQASQATIGSRRTSRSGKSNESHSLFSMSQESYSSFSVTPRTIPPPEDQKAAIPPLILPEITKAARPFTPRIYGRLNKRSRETFARMVLEDEERETWAYYSGIYGEDPREPLPPELQESMGQESVEEVTDNFYEPTTDFHVVHSNTEIVAKPNDTEPHAQDGVEFGEPWKKKESADVFLTSVPGETENQLEGEQTKRSTTAPSSARSVGGMGRAPHPRDAKISQIMQQSEGGHLPNEEAELLKKYLLQSMNGPLTPAQMVNERKAMEEYLIRQHRVMQIQKHSKVNKHKLRWDKERVHHRLARTKEMEKGYIQQKVASVKAARQEEKTHRQIVNSALKARSKDQIRQQKEKSREEIDELHEFYNSQAEKIKTETQMKRELMLKKRFLSNMTRLGHRPRCKKCEEFLAKEDDDPEAFDETKHVCKAISEDTSLLDVSQKVEEHQHRRKEIGSANHYRRGWHDSPQQHIPIRTLQRPTTPALSGKVHKPQVFMMGGGFKVSRRECGVPNAALIPQDVRQDLADDVLEKQATMMGAPANTEMAQVDSAEAGLEALMLEKEKDEEDADSRVSSARAMRQSTEIGALVDVVPAGKDRKVSFAGSVDVDEENPVSLLKGAEFSTGTTASGITAITETTDATITAESSEISHGNADTSGTEQGVTIMVPSVSSAPKEQK